MADPASLLTRVQAAKCRRSLAEFFRQGWHVLEATTPLVWSWHIPAVCDHIQAVLEDWMAKRVDPAHDQRIRNLLINIPPGTSKSRMVSVYTPAWMWLHCPEWRAIYLSANPRVALRDSVYCRDVIRSDWYQGLFQPDWALSEDQDAKGLYRNTRGGFRMAIGISARIVGERADALVVDDPHDPEEVLSDAMREEVKDRWTMAISNRVNDPRSSVRIGIMQRVHEADWSGLVLEEGTWEHLCIPREYDPADARTTAIGWHDPRTVDGEILDPERFTPAVQVEEKKKGTYYYAGQQNQKPVPRGGGLFKRHWLPIIDALPAALDFIRFWDLAAAEDGDYTAGVKMGRTDDGLFYVADVVHGRWTPHERDAVIRQTAALDGIGVPIVIEQEPGSAGVSLIDSMVRMLAGYAVHGERATGDKVVRAGPLAAQAEAGNIRLLKAEWNRVYIDELTTFPFGKFDDQIDASSGAFNRLARQQDKWGFY